MAHRSRYLGCVLLGVLCAVSAQPPVGQRLAMYAGRLEAAAPLCVWIPMRMIASPERHEYA